MLGRLAPGMAILATGSKVNRLQVRSLLVVLLWGLPKLAGEAVPSALFSIKKE